jgi:hypothetical protein
MSKRRSDAQPRPGVDAQHHAMGRNALRVLRFVADQFDVAVNELTCPRRYRRLVRHRAAFVWIARNGLREPMVKTPERFVPASFTVLAEALGRTDHSTAVHLLSRAEDFRLRDEEFRSKTDRLLAVVLAGRIPEPPAAVAPIAAVPLHIEPFRLTACRKRKNDLARDDRDAIKRLRASQSFIEALRREHPERCAA